MFLLYIRGNDGCMLCVLYYVVRFALCSVFLHYVHQVSLSPVSPLTSFSLMYYQCIALCYLRLFVVVYKHLHTVVFDQGDEIYYVYHLSFCITANLCELYRHVYSNSDVFIVRGYFSI